MIPHCARFLVTTTFIFMAYVFCGWLVLGMHNEKFETIPKSGTTLFAMLNGDDLYTTFDMTDFSNLKPHATAV